MTFPSSPTTISPAKNKKKIIIINKIKSPKVSSNLSHSEMEANCAAKHVAAQGRKQQTRRLPESEGIVSVVLVPIS